MEKAGIFRRVQRLRLETTLLAGGMRLGNARSAFKGQGVEFREVRAYTPGDDPRLIDWNVSARMGGTYVRLYREERELPLFILLDISASMGSVQDEGSALSSGGLAASLLCYASEVNGDRFGLCLFDSEPREVFPARRGTEHLRLVIRSIEHSRSIGDRSRLDLALQSAEQCLKKRGVVFLISDFLSEGWEEDARRLAHRHDLILCRVLQPAEMAARSLSGSGAQAFSRGGFFAAVDPESGEPIFVDPGSARFRASLSRWEQERTRALKSAAPSGSLHYFEIASGADPLPSLLSFFGARRAGRG
jgi:uncharacterized protein (DUF58 family)